MAKLSPLGTDDYQPVVRRMAYGPGIADQIIDGVKGNRAVSELLTTPLMVALLVLRYRAENTIPQNIVDFYDHLFLLLLQRHDKSKGGYVRPRRSQLTEMELQEAFDALCFLTRKADHGSFTITQMREHAKKSLSLSKHEADPALFLDDIRDVTCLILEEGGEYRFIHKSVQEYHAACCVRNQPEDSAAFFYKNALDRWSNWREEMKFLSSIDKYRFIKFFAIPDLRMAISGTYEGSRNALEEVTKADVDRVLGHDGPLFTLGKAPVPDFTAWYCQSSSKRWCLHGDLAEWRLGKIVKNLDWNRVLESVRNKEMPALRRKTSRGMEIRVKLTDVLQSSIMDDQLLRAGKRLFAQFKNELDSGLAFVHKVENKREIFAI